MNNPATDMQYVYKYIIQSSKVVYVGITNNLVSRIKQHEHDKLSVLNNPTIMYFPVKHRQDAEILETYLINHYGSGKYFNVKKKDRGNVSFLGECDELPWITFDGNVDLSAKPFSIDSFVKREVVREEVIKEVPIVKYVDTPQTDAEIIKMAWEEQAEALDYLEEESDAENKIIKALMLLLTPNTQWFKKDSVSDEDIKEGIALHRERLSVIKKMIAYYNSSVIERESSELDELMKQIVIVNNKIEMHESSIKQRKETDERRKDQV